MKKTKLIIGVGVSAFLAVGIAQTNLQPHLGKRLKSSEPYVLTNVHADASLWLPTTLSATGSVISYDNLTNDTNHYILELKVNGTLTWYLTNAPQVEMVISTNHTINWATIEELMAGTVPRAKQVGSVQTNRVMTVVHDGATNIVLLKVLGKEEWPSQTRVVQGRRQ